MNDNHFFPNGTFGWVELATTDCDGAKKFYQKLLNWGHEDKPIPQGGTYTLARLNGKDVAGMYTLMEEQKKQNVPPHWLSYVLVESVDEKTEKVKTLGGKVVMPPMDVMDIGRMSVLQDPAGAHFALWQSKTHQGAGDQNNTPGTFCWNELYTSNLKEAERFYASLFDWSPQAQDMGETSYTVFMNGDKPAGGVMEIQKEWGEVPPPSWMVYFSVENCDESTELASSLGGKVTLTPRDIPGIGRFSMLLDPQNAGFALIQLKQN